MLRTIRNIAISIAVMAVLFGGAGVAYLYFTGKNNTNAQAEPIPDPKPQASGLPTPHKPSANAPESAGVEALTSPVKPGENSSITVQTLPTSNCTITVTYNNIPSKDSGLIPKAADDYGNVSWSWKVEPATAEGIWPVKVTCAYNKKSAVVIGNLQVSKK
jgi:hypothetical protein